MTLPDFDLPDFAHLSARLGFADPSEAHGVLCGMLCANVALPSGPWLERIRGDAAVEDLPAREILLELFAATVSQLTDEEMGFLLLLPDDETALSIRADALGHWCQGFLSGLGLGGAGECQDLPPEAQEFLDDLGKIAFVGFDSDAADEADETAYAEIVEYIRVGVMLIHQASRAGGPWDSQSFRAH
jgi:hypothetical protein